MQSILGQNQAQKALKLKCFSNLKIRSQEFFEFSDHSVLSNLYWGIHNAESASQSECVEERETKLETSEKMLQIPASLDANGATLGIPNTYLVCCSYFYLSVVEFMRNNDCRAAMHFLHAVSICPRIVCNDFAPGIFHSLLPLFIRHRADKSFTYSWPLDDFDEAMVDDVMRWIARRFKPWLMYYQIMSTGDFCRPAANRDIHSRTNSNAEPMLQPSTADEGEVSMFERRKRMEAQTTRSSSIKCLKDILTESEPDTPDSSVDDTFSQICVEEDQEAEDLNWTWRTPCMMRRRGEVNETRALQCIPRSFSSSFCDANVSALGLRSMHHYIGPNPTKTHHKRLSRMSKSLSCRTTLQQEDSLVMEPSGVVERIISNLCFTEEFEGIEQDYTVEMKTIYEMLNTKSGLKYSLLKDMILDQLLIAISTSKEERVVRTSVAILSTIVTTNRSVVDDIKRKGLQLYDLATALKHNVHEAVILIYLINPSPAEIKTLELLPCLVEVVCASTSYKVEFTSLLLTPPAASLMIIEMLVTAFDYETNGMHLAAISSPRVLSGLLQVPRTDKLEEFVSLASILVKCMRFDGKCRKYIADFSPLAPFVSLLWSNKAGAASTALEFFNELLRMPRSSAIGLLEQMQKQGSINNMCALFLLTQNSELEYKLLAANLLLQLEVLEDASAKCIYREEAAEALFDSLKCEESPATQALSSFILANLGGTYTWAGEAYTMAWLVKKTGLTLAHHRNLIKTYDFLDQSLQDAGIDSWCSRIAQRMLQLGTRVFDALDKGLNSKTRRVSRESLMATAWLGLELMKGPDELRHAACEILLHSVEQFVHPGFEIEERLLACLCIYNYTSGRGMKRIVNLSEGVRESLRRLSNVTWMAEELLKVADYFQPNKWRISCVHNQVLEAGTKCSGAVTALIYYKGYLCSGYADGSIKAWDIKGQTATLVLETKEHKKAVTCLALYDPGNCLLSGSADKTIKMWQMVQRNLECIEVIPTKESVRSIDSSGELIFARTQSHKLKMIDASRKAKDVFKNKCVKCMRVAQGKVYAGCSDSSIQELMITNNRHQEMKEPSKRWMQNKPISSISMYKEWLYSASLVVEGSKTKDWRRSNGPQTSIVPEKGGSILEMEVVEDFIYLNCSTSMSSLQIWLRGTQQKVGRLSAGSKITSLLSANDMILCGTEKGVIKGWIPL